MVATDYVDGRENGLKLLAVVSTAMLAPGDRNCRGKVIIGTSMIYHRRWINDVVSANNLTRDDGL